jgi:hypothetical protein
MSEQDLEKNIETYKEVARENPGVDVNLLMVNALETESKKHTAGKSYKWAYVVALGLPPFGLIYTVKYYINGDEEDKYAGKVCALLTVVSILLVLALGKVFFSSAGVSPTQIEQIKPADIQQLYQ